MSAARQWKAIEEVWVGDTQKREAEREMELEETLFRGGLVVRARAVGVPPRRAYRDTETKV